jgi:nucleotide-binding universal stress UspA family protein
MVITHVEAIFHATVLFSKILVGVDGSPSAEKALKYAIDLANTYHGKLMIVHVILRRFYAVAPSEAGVLSTTVYVKEVEEEGKEIISRAESLVRAAGIDFECKVLQGVPAEEIVKTAQSEKVDLIVLGSRGLDEVRASLLGSVSDKVTIPNA